MVRSRAVRKWSYLLSTKQTPPYSKAELRKSLRNKNLVLTAAQRQSAARQAEKLFLAAPLLQTSQHIACYLAHGGEFDLQPIITALWRLGKICYLPVLAATQNVLHFIAYAEHDELQTNRYNILEPPLDPTREIAAQKLDLVLTPLAGFDLHGHRLGSGGGFYDRTFAFLTQQPRPLKPILLGVAYAHQEAQSVPPDAWDVQLDGVLTEEKLLLF